MKAGIVICTRLKSNRVPGKALKSIGGVPVLDNLVSRIQKSGVPIYIACPFDEVNSYAYLESKFEAVKVYGGHKDSPLKRTYKVAKDCGLDAVIRITHDKILVDPDEIKILLNRFYENDLDYLFSSDFTDGSRFEIMSFKSISEAVDKFTGNVEFISYAVKEVTDNVENVRLKGHDKNLRFLIDYPEDVTFFEVLFANLGTDVSLTDAIKYCQQNHWINKINKLPRVTVYTCAYNAEKHLRECIESVCNQKNFNDIEYILIDDKSTDGTPSIMANATLMNSNIQYHRNQENLGLASSSNIALSKAKGDYIIRLDADDYFTYERALMDMYRPMKERNLEILYPNYFDGDQNTLGVGRETHHVGGALFKTRSLNNIKFSDGLRGHDSLDIYLRARKNMKIGYMNKPTFFYRNTENSLSKTNLDQRENIKKQLLEAHA